MFVGNISGEVKSTNFTIRLDYPGIEKGSYVKVHHEIYGWVLARVDHLKRFLDDMDDEKTIARAHTIGYRDGSEVQVPKTPFKPEEKVYSADRDLIIDVLGLMRGKKGSIYLGLMEGNDIPVYLNLHKTIGKHVSVLAKTGAGKSYSVGVLLEGILANKFPVVIIDPHGEYGSLAVENDDYDSMVKYNIKPRAYADQIVEYAVNKEANPGAKKLTLPSNFEIKELLEMLPFKFGDNQKGILFEAMERLGEEDYDLPRLIEEVQDDPSRSRWKVISGLETLMESEIFSGEPITPTKLVKDGMCSILNLKGGDPHLNQLTVAKITKDLFEAKKLNKIPDFLYLVEEAHNFCPERGFGESISSEILRTVAGEGRKFGFYLCVVSQRPARIDKNVLSQCNTQIILKVTNPNDLRAITQSIEGFTPGMENDIKQLSVGHALLMGECVEQPITVDIRVRETLHGSQAPPSIEEEAEEGDGEKEDESSIEREEQDGAPRPYAKPSHPRQKKPQGVIEKIKPYFIEDEDEEKRRKPKGSMIGGKLKKFFLKDEEEE
ncbi:MAG: ATP-binding protein [Candidatus Altiarchaeota archaeon]